MCSRLTGSLRSFTDRTLRGVGQVMLQNNPVTGALFLLGIFISSWVAGLYAVVGTVAATETAMMSGAPRGARLPRGGSARADGRSAECHPGGGSTGSTRC